MIACPDYLPDAQRLAVNEACDLSDPASKDCAIGQLCPFCSALAKTLTAAMCRAYRKGFEDAGEAGKLITPHRVG